MCPEYLVVLESKKMLKEKKHNEGSTSKVEYNIKPFKSGLHRDFFPKRTVWKAEKSNFMVEKHGNTILYFRQVIKVNINND